MIAPLVGLGFASAGFLLGSLPSSFYAANYFDDDSNTRERLLRRRFVIPVMVLLPLAGWMTDLWGARDVALLGLLILTAGLAVMAFLPLVRASSTTLLGIALGVAFLAVGLIAWMPASLGHPGRAVEGLNLGFIAITLGWLVGPMLAKRLDRLIGPGGTLISMALGAAISLIVLLNGDDSLPIAPAHDALHDTRFWLLILALGLYFPVESCLEVWSEPFLRDLGERRPGYTQSRLIGFWIAFLAARLATFALVRTGLEPWFLLSCAAISAMVLGNLAGAYGLSSGGFGFWIVGFCYGPLLPGFLGLIAQLVPTQFGIVLGLLLAMGTLYQFLLGPFLHRYAATHPPRVAMRVPVFLTLLLAAPLLLVTLMR